MSHVVQIRVTYRVENCSNNDSALRAAKSILFNSGDTWHDENQVNVTTLEVSSNVEEEL